MLGFVADLGKFCRTRWMPNPYLPLLSGSLIGEAAGRYRTQVVNST